MKLATALAAGFLACAALGVQATTPADVETITVRYADLDLDREAGVATLYQRIRGAAKRVCAEHAGERLVSKQAYAACLEGAVMGAVARIGRPMLSEYVARRLGERVPGTPAQ